MAFHSLLRSKMIQLPMYTYLTYAYHYLTFKLGSEKVKCSLAVPFVDNISLLPFLLSVWEILWCTVFVQQTLPLPYPRVKLWPHVCVPLPLLELLILLPQSWRSVEWRILECSLLLLGLAVTFQANLSLSWYGVINQVLVEKKEWLIPGRMQCWQLITQFVLLLFPFAQVLGGGGGGGGRVGLYSFFMSSWKNRILVPCMNYSVIILISTHELASALGWWFFLPLFAVLFTGRNIVLHLRSCYIPYFIITVWSMFIICIARQLFMVRYTLSCCHFCSSHMVFFAVLISIC